MYRIHTNPNNGYRSVIATQDIKKGTIILNEKPALIGEDMYDIIYKLYNEDEDISMFKDLVPFEIDDNVIKYEKILMDIKTLPFYIRNFFLIMDPEEIRLLCAKFYRNAFRYKTESAILYQGRLFNHSCNYNVEFELDEKNNSYIFRTTRDIKKNEELTDHYINTNLPFKQRRKLLFDQYAFNCLCLNCLSSK